MIPPDREGNTFTMNRGGLVLKRKKAQVITLSGRTNTLTWAEVGQTFTQRGANESGRSGEILTRYL